MLGMEIITVAISLLRHATSLAYYCSFLSIFMAENVWMSATIVKPLFQRVSESSKIVCNLLYGGLGSLDLVNLLLMVDSFRRFCELSTFCLNMNLTTYEHMSHPVIERACERAVE